MKNIPSILFIVIFAIGTAQAQLASDKPALLLPAVNSLSKPANGQVKLA
ncbi:hypothetical protein [Emticicia sp. BO119]|nr:hypothetical protein [Emticicia sp. BO119]MBA4851403.1 hypothetical protein [Emticicia sp. BO119]